MSPEPRHGAWPPTRTWIDHTVTVAASQDEVFGLLADLDGWPDWTPGLLRIRRLSARGGRFAMLLALPGFPIAWVPCQLYAFGPDRIEWGGGRFGSVIRHRFELRQTEPGRTTVRHVEYATGVLAALLLPFERSFHAHDRRWSAALAGRFPATD